MQEPQPQNFQKRKIQMSRGMIEAESQRPAIQGKVDGREHHNIPESLSAFCRIVSLTAAKTSRMFVVSVAWVRLSVVSLALAARHDQGHTGDKGLGVLD